MRCVPCLTCKEKTVSEHSRFQLCKKCKPKVKCPNCKKEFEVKQMRKNSTGACQNCKNAWRKKSGGYDDAG
jgi:hypothetical protein